MTSGVEIVPDPKKTVEISPSVFIVLYCYTRSSIPIKKLSSPFLNVYFFLISIYLFYLTPLGLTCSLSDLSVVVLKLLVSASGI